jgi:transposase-like protein
LKNYSTELRESILAKMLPPNNASVPLLARDTGIPRDTLYGWRRQALGRGQRPATSASPLEGLSSEEKFTVVMETAALNERELGEYCRRKGLFAEQIATWRETCREANAPLPSKAERAEIQRLNREVLRKDKALAEAAALLVLQKKVRAIWEESGDAPSPFSGASK